MCIYLLFTTKKLEYIKIVEFLNLYIYYSLKNPEYIKIGNF